MSKIFNDPIHGRIEIPDYCVKIIDTIPFQRLRNLKQLGLTCYVFPGATHTRFEHSIGVCYLSGEWAKHLQRRHPDLGITDNDIKIVMISGLIHDIGHGPFSHTFEKFIKKCRKDFDYNHEDMTIKIFKWMENGCDQNTIDQVCKIIEGKPLNRNKFLAHIVHNTVNGLDSDKLDYFIRDSQCTSFAIGCDWKRIIYESSVKDDQIVFPYKMVGDIFNLYQTRFRLYKELYYHKTVRMIEETLLNLMVYIDKNNPHVIPLSKTIDDVHSFILINDDIISQMERCGIDYVTKGIETIKKRDFKTIVSELKLPKTIAHYGMGKANPLNYVKFIDKHGEYKEIDNNIIDSMCPRKFFIEL